jgi:hypothetical protein
MKTEIDTRIQISGKQDATNHLINRSRWRSRRFSLPAQRLGGRIPAAGCNRPNNNAGGQKIGFSAPLLMSYGFAIREWLRAELAAAGICEMACSLSGHVDAKLAQTDPSDSGHRAEPPMPPRINPTIQKSTNPFPQPSQRFPQPGLMTDNCPATNLRKWKVAKAYSRLGKATKMHARFKVKPGFNLELSSTNISTDDPSRSLPGDDRLLLPPPVQNSHGAAPITFYVSRFTPDSHRPPVPSGRLQDGSLYHGGSKFLRKTGAFCFPTLIPTHDFNGCTGPVLKVSNKTKAPDGWTARAGERPVSLKPRCGRSRRHFPFALLGVHWRLKSSCLFLVGKCSLRRGSTIPFKISNVRSEIPPGGPAACSLKPWQRGKVLSQTYPGTHSSTHPFSQPSQRIPQPGLMADHCPASSPQQTNTRHKQTVTNPDKAKQTSKKMAQTNFVSWMDVPPIHPTLPPRSVAVVTDLLALLQVITGFHALERIKNSRRNAHKPVGIVSNHPRATLPWAGASGPGRHARVLGPSRPPIKNLFSLLDRFTHFAQDSLFVNNQNSKFYNQKSCSKSPILLSAFNLHPCAS